MKFAHANSPVSGRKAQFFYEWAFHQCVNDINLARKMENKPVITVSKAKRLRSQVLSGLGERDRDFTDAGMDLVRREIDKTLSSENEGRPIFGETDAGKARFSGMLNDFSANTKFKEVKGVNIDEPMIPLSPYDSRFANRATFMKNGSALMYINADAINLENGRLTKDYQNPELQYMDMRGTLHPAGDFTTQDDKSGMARLLRYIPQKDYQSLSDWVNSVPEDQYMSKDAVDRSVAILEYLQDNGYDYEISRDRHAGQLKADIKGTKINIRIADTKANDNYIGSVYNGGDRIYFNTTPSGGQKERAVYDITPQDSVNLVKFAMGEHVERQDIASPVGQFGTFKSDRITKPNSYYSDKGYSAVYKAASYESGKPCYVKTTIHVENRKDSVDVKFQDGQQGEDYLRDAIHSAHDNFRAGLDIDRLIEEAREHAYDDEYSPQLSGDDGIAAIQQSYWEVLTGKQSDLIRAGKTADDYAAVRSEGGDFDSVIYTGTPEEKVRQHMDDLANITIGQFEPDENGERFDPAAVSRYMSSASGTYRNNDNLIRAMKAMDMDASELKGNEYANNQIKNRMIKFDRSSAKPMYQSSNPFIQTMFGTIKTTLAETGCDVQDRDILMDENGIVQYTGTRRRGWGTVSAPNGKTEAITGEIGQIFVPDGLGMVTTKYASGDNYIFVPGYNATVIPQKDGENLSLEERTRLRGYEQEMKKSIAYQIRSDLVTNDTQIGDTTSLNGVHHRMYDTRFPIDVIERAVSVDGMRQEVFEATIKTLSKRVRYSNDFKEGSTINADFQANRDNGFSDTANDNFADPYRLSGRRNMSVMTEESFGYFDKFATSTSTNQGIVRFLTDSAEVDPDGKIIRGDIDDKTPLMKIDEMRYSDYSPFDRQQMVFSNMLTARAIASDVHMAQMTFGGWTMDDGYVVSKEFAETHQIRDTEGKLRPMTIGDKICDFGGNKGVISLVVDPDMSLEEAREKGIEEPVKWFKANKENGNHLDVVGAPFPAVSRFNGSSTKLLMENPMDLIGPDGKVYERCMGNTSFIITDMPVDEKTHDYGEDDIAQGKGRKASSQLAWALASYDAVKVLDEFYSANSSATSNLRETLITMGLDMSPTGELMDHYEPHPGEERKVFEMPDLEYVGPEDKKRLNIAKMRREFGNVIQNQGGIMEVPFPLKYPTGAELPPLNDNKTDVVYKKDEWERKGYTRKDGTYVRPTTVHRHDDANTQRGGNAESYGLPVMSSHLRSGQEFNDGTVSRHDYTNSYQAIYEAACCYRDELSKGSACSQEKLNKYQADAQRGFNQITGDLKSRKFDNNKHNIFKDSIMSARQSHSFTAVWTADPRLDIDQIGVSKNIAESMGVKEGDYIVTLRDPVLRGVGVSFDRVHIDDNIIGVSVNPVMAPKKDGDFDGDSIGGMKLTTQAAYREAYMKMTAGSTLLNPNSGKLFMQDGLDLASSYAVRPELKAEREAIEGKINAFESDTSLSDIQRFGKQQQAIKDLSDHVRRTLEPEYGTDMVSYKDPESHLRSLTRFIDHGAKGNYSKLQDYMKYMGYEADMTTKDGKPVGIDYLTLKDLGHTKADYNDAMDTMYATAIKAFGTGVAGKFSQRGMAAMRDLCPMAVLEATYGNTQGVLQAKHDPVDARHRYEMLMTTARDLWRGYKLDKMVDMDGIAHWTAARSEGKPVQATREEFEQQFHDVYGKEGLGCDVNPKFIRQLTDALADEAGNVVNIEKTRLKCSSTLDRLTYGGGFESVMEAAKNHENLFDGKYTSHFAPSTIRRNKEAMENGEFDKVKGITKSDTRKDFVASKNKSEAAVTIDMTVNIHRDAPKKAPEKAVVGASVNTSSSSKAPRGYEYDDILNSGDALEKNRGDMGGE